jgi:hypothetical protein
MRFFRQILTDLPRGSGRFCDTGFAFSPPPKGCKLNILNNYLAATETQNQGFFGRPPLFGGYSGVRSRMNMVRERGPHFAANSILRRAGIIVCKPIPGVLRHFSFKRCTSCAVSSLKFPRDRQRFTSDPTRACAFPRTIAKASAGKAANQKVEAWREEISVTFVTLGRRVPLHAQ